MPITIQVTGFARSAAVKLHTLDMSGVSAPFANRNPALRSLNPEIMTTSLPSIFCAARHAFRPLAVRESTETSTCSLPPFSWGCVLVLY